MRKRIIGTEGTAPEIPTDTWLDLERLAQVEVSSEDPARPIESALVPGGEGGWRAAGPGKQTLRLLFDEPLRVRRIHLVVSEAQVHRTQELAISARREGSSSWQALVRQQFTFSPDGATREVEDYAVNVDLVRGLEVVIVPEIGGGAARASLASLRVA